MNCPAEAAIAGTANAETNTAVMAARTKVLRRARIDRSFTESSYLTSLCIGWSDEVIERYGWVD
jgi:hypothetical protein